MYKLNLQNSGLQTGYKLATNRVKVNLFFPTQMLQSNPPNNSLPGTACGLDSFHPKLPAVQVHVQIDILQIGQIRNAG